MIQKLGFLAREGLQNIRVNRQMTIASIGVLIACMLLIGSSILLSANVNAVMGYVESMNEIVVWIPDDATESEIEDLGLRLSDVDNVEKVTYVSREAALAQERERLGDAAVILDGFEDDNPYPASYVITARDLSELNSLVEALESEKGVDSVSAPTELAKTITDVKKGISIAGLFVVGILTIVAIIIVSNTIKVTVFNRKREISIMKYVGATDAFIRIPFLVEGMTIGLIAAVLSFLCLWLGYIQVLDWVRGTTSTWLGAAAGSLISFSAIAPTILVCCLLGGIAFGLFGSLIYVGKYLKV